MRFSHYNILSSQTKEGKYVLLNGFTGLLDVIDKEAYDLISSYTEADDLPPDVIESLSGIKEQFYERGYLTDLSYEKEIAAAKKKALELYAEYLKAEWDVVIVPTLACNYRCTYCFEKGSGYPTPSMSKNQVDAIFRIIPDKIGSGERITLYGGEPLAKENRHIVEYIVDKGREIGRTFFAVTNAHDLDHYMDLLGDGGISTLQITVDGPKRIHDHRRIALDKSSSYEKIMHNIEIVLHETTAAISLRINIDKRNVQYILEFLEDLEKRGILDHKNLQLAASPIVGVGDLRITSDDIRKLEKESEERYPQLKDNFMSRTRTDNSNILASLYLGEIIHPKVAACGAAGTTKIFTPEGKIYPCWGCIGQTDQVIGTYDESGNIIWNETVVENWRKNSIAYNECLECKYAFLCGSGCRRPALPGETTSHDYDCEYYRDLFADYLAKVVEHV